MRTDKTDLGLTIIAAALLLLLCSYFAQCSSARRSETGTVSAPATATSAREAAEEREREREGRPQSVRDFADEEQREEREKIKSVSRALQTIAADPVLRKTYGFNQ